MDISCSRKLFQSMGILCRHALKVFYLHNFTNLLECYLLKRWTKEAKKGLVVGNCTAELSGNNTQSGQLLRLSELMHARTEIYSIVSLRVSGTRIVKEQLAHTVKLWEDDMETMSIFENSKKMDDHSNHNVLVNDKLVLNPAKMVE